MEIPSELKCPICGYLLEDAVMLPCCAASTCLPCAREGLEVGEGRCPLPECGIDDTDPDDLIPNRRLRSKAITFKDRNPGVPVRPARKKVVEVVKDLLLEEAKNANDEEAEVTKPEVTKPEVVKEAEVSEDSKDEISTAEKEDTSPLPAAATKLSTHATKCKEEEEKEEDSLPMKDEEKNNLENNKERSPTPEMQKEKEEKNKEVKEKEKQRKDKDGDAYREGIHQSLLRLDS
jgi:hypothetical protein